MTLELIHHLAAKFAYGYCQLSVLSAKHWRLLYIFFASLFFSTIYCCIAEIFFYYFPGYFGIFFTLFGYLFLYFSHIRLDLSHFSSSPHNTPWSKRVVLSVSIHKNSLFVCFNCHEQFIVFSFLYHFDFLGLVFVFFFIYCFKFSLV